MVALDGQFDLELVIVARRLGLELAKRQVELHLSIQLDLVLYLNLEDLLVLPGLFRHHLQTLLLHLLFALTPLLLGQDAEHLEVESTLVVIPVGIQEVEVVQQLLDLALLHVYRIRYQYKDQ